MRCCDVVTVVMKVCVLDVSVIAAMMKFDFVDIFFAVEKTTCMICWAGWDFCTKK